MRDYLQTGTKVIAKQVSVLSSDLNLTGKRAPNAMQPTYQVDHKIVRLKGYSKAGFDTVHVHERTNSQRREVQGNNTNECIKSFSYASFDKAK